ncbi:ATP-binding protein [Candidatus Margulisiibacteriota bacterium]
MIEKIVEIQLALVREIEDYSFKRYLFDKINLKDRLIGIIGARGLGKTTLLLQYYLSYYNNPQDCLYLSADNINVINHGLYNLAEEFFKYGGKTLLLDEIHKYPGWQVELKNIYDSFPKKKIIFSGSSALNILKGKADLSRRAVFYNLKGLSFREFIELSTGKVFPLIKLEELLKKHIYLANKINGQITVLRVFNKYLKYGYYPFFKEGIESFDKKLNNVVEKIICEDIPSLYNIKYSTVFSLKKLFYLVATSQPFIPNISRMSSQLGISKEYIYTYIQDLEKAGLFILLYPKEKGFRLLRKPQKIYLENPNLFHLVRAEKGFEINMGNTRETFFINQASGESKLFYSARGDFLNSRGELFEIGGKGKKPISLKRGITVADNITVGFGNKIPIWLFGFLY